MMMTKNKMMMTNMMMMKKKTTELKYSGCHHHWEGESGKKQPLRSQPANIRSLSSSSSFCTCPPLHHLVLVLLFIIIIIITMIMIVIFAANLPTFDPCRFHHHHPCLDRHQFYDHHDLDQRNEISPSFWRFASGLGEFGSCQEFQSPRIEDLGGRDWRKVENKKHSKSTNFNIPQNRNWGICVENLWRHIVKRTQFGSLVTNEV